LQIHDTSLHQYSDSVSTVETNPLIQKENDSLKIALTEITGSLTQAKQKVAELEESKKQYEEDARELKLTIEEKETRLLLIESKSEEEARLRKLLRETEEREKRLLP
jgi:chromosome segregation ATPase